MVSSVLTVAPLRMSFVGGGSDIDSFYGKQEGSVVSCAIEKYVFVHVKIHDDSFGERYRISYSQVEHVQELSDIKNDIVRNCLEFMEIASPVQISTLSDLPAGTGLGSSSSFTVALLLALHELKGQHPTRHQLAEEACHIEINLLKHPIGKQDQYAAAFGGFNFIRFKTDNRVVVEPMCVSASQLSELLSRCRLYWTKMERSAEKILADQAGRAAINLDGISQLVILAQEFREVLESKSINWNQVSEIINRSWDLKQNFSPLISAKSIQYLIDQIRSRENFGAKLLGAGGGGFVLAFDGSQVSSTENHPPIDAAVNSFIPTADHYGARVISVF